MKIRYEKGNLLLAKEHVIVHGCNARGDMKSGVARDIRARYPKAYEDYRQRYETDGLRMGDVVWSVNNPHIVGNAITQKSYGRDKSVRYMSYDAIADMVEECNKLAVASSEVNAIAFPFIGAGLANGNWAVIATIIEELAAFEPVVYYKPEWLPDGLPDDVLGSLDIS